MFKWYTRARKFPQLVGRTPDGTRIPGGPYTYTQIAVVVATVVVMWNTTWLWARGSLLSSAAIFVVVLFAAGFGAGQLPPGMRNPFLMIGGVCRLLKPGWTLNGRPLPARRPTVVAQQPSVTEFVCVPTSSKQTPAHSEPDTTVARPVTDVAEAPTVKRPLRKKSAAASTHNASLPGELSPVQQLLVGGRA